VQRFGLVPSIATRALGLFWTNRVGGERNWPWPKLTRPVAFAESRWNWFASRGTYTAAGLKNVASFLEKKQLAGMVVRLLYIDLALAAAHQALKQGIPFVTSGSSSPRLSEALGKFFYMACFGDNVQAATAA